jgi:putative oxidoreductase
MTNHQILRISRVVLRVALGITFLVAIADRFGLLGPYGSKNVSWGDWKHFEQNVAILNWFIPKTLIPALAAVETALEAALGVALLAGIYPRIVAWSSAALLMSFALTMSIALGIVAPVSYSVFTAAGSALLLGAVTDPGATSVASAINPMRS